MQDVGKLILRLTIGGLLLLHGIGKILHSEGAMGFIQAALTAKGLPAQIAYGVYIGEVLGPLMLIAGYWSRLGALAVVVNMTFTLILAKMDAIATLNQGHGWSAELEGLYLLGALAIMFLGSGRFAVSRGLGKLD